MNKNNDEQKIPLVNFKAFLPKEIESQLKIAMYTGSSVYIGEFRTVTFIAEY